MFIFRDCGRCLLVRFGSSNSWIVALTTCSRIWWHSCTNDFETEVIVKTICRPESRLKCGENSRIESLKIRNRSERISVF
ncbi:hypothetical protein PHAVU_006G199600 [Phaseolus vulgaris]|uniref:Uncharacterized protein n=1 Tax=Phaseolus vulgaris TaxID=3885 RepID=V7BTF9_PHAVU|nr:hypothetical protein PHAVU_006G199600g [Phaseolus vulgaris]ESW20323.1 hypothetical protein PHAVU_006G199600g [Phaseolus vulgaris]